ncbi:ferritin [Chloroflexi bacterium TSY]|nr:ferritin [Chloroflexi bacterium TSY]
MNVKIQNALNDQINHEFYAFYSYLAMSAWLEANDWPGFAQWIRQHSDEEQMHAMKIYDYVNDRSGVVTLQAIDQPTTEFDSVQELFEAALEHERTVTASINRIYQLAQEEGDYPTQVLMEWFIQEQVEEEKLVEDALVMIKRADNNPFQLLYVDNQIDQIQPAQNQSEAG